MPLPYKTYNMEEVMGPFFRFSVLIYLFELLGAILQNIVHVSIFYPVAMWSTESFMY